MAIALVGNNHTSATSSAIDTSNANLLVLMQSAGLTGYADPTDSKSNTWTPLTAKSLPGSRLQIYYAFNPIVGTGHTFTCHSSSGQTLFASAWSGMLATSGVFDNQSGNVNSGAPTTQQPGSISPFQAGELFITSVANNQSGLTFSIDSSFVIQDNQLAFDNFCSWAYLVNTGTGALNPTWTSTVAGGMITVMASFIPASSVPTDTATEALQYQLS